MKQVYVIGSAGAHEVMLRGPDGLLSDVRAFSGVPLISQLLGGKLRSERAEDDVDIPLSQVGLTLPNAVSRFVFRAKATGEVITLDELLGERTPADHASRRPPPEVPEHRLLVVHDISSIKPDRTAWKALIAQRADQWTVVHTDDPSWLEGLSSATADRRLLVMEADDLRAMDASISKGRSWDESFIDLVTYLDGPGSKLMRLADHVLVRFGTCGLVHAHRGEGGTSFTAFYRSKEREADLEPGEAFGLGEVFVARLVMELVREVLPVGVNATGAVERAADERDIPQRIHFAGREALRSVHRAHDLGWRVIQEELGLPNGVFALRTGSPEVVAGADVTALPQHGSLLKLAMHGSDASLLSWALHHVRSGDTGALGGAPIVAFGHLRTADREEIEQLRDLESRVRTYLRGPKKAPLTIGVFGPPGSGKSFGVKQVAASLGRRVQLMEFDLSPLTSYEQFVHMLHQVRDASMGGVVPFVIIDEFDSSLGGESYGWFRHFLEPALKGIFRDGDLHHPVGPAVLVFTGGTCDSYEDFERKSRGGDPPDAMLAAWAREHKMPDMASRLRDHLNVKGISELADDVPGSYLVRRAVVLRSMLLKKFDQADPKQLPIEPGVLLAMLQLPRYKNGTRSMEGLVDEWKLDRNGRLSRNSIAGDDRLKNTVDPERFRELMQQDDHLHDVVEKLARMIHENWRAAQDPADGKEANVPWEELPEHYKDSNRMQAMDMVRKLTSAGYRIVKGGAPSIAAVTFTDEDVERMAQMEHDRWMKEKLAAGWTYGPQRNNLLRIHPLLVPYDKLNEKDKEMDRDPVMRIPEWLGRVGLGVVKVEPLAKGQDE